MLMAPPAPPPESAVAWSLEVAISVTAPPPMLAERMPASVEASEVTLARASAVATAINPTVISAALTVAVFAEVEVAVTLVPFVTLPRNTAFVEAPTSASGSSTCAPNSPPAAPSESAAALFAECAVTVNDPSV